MLYELLEPGSLLFIGVPGLLNIDKHYNSDFLRFLQLPHLVHFDLEHLIVLARANGFEVLGGNETVQAVFVKSIRKGVDTFPGIEPTVTFIAGLEHRRRKKLVKSWIQHFPTHLGQILIKNIEESQLPISVRLGLINILRKIKRLLSINR